ncbi:MAG: helicase associated domain-containing protein [Anaerotignum sp.]|nr:helicase associated domain-containing protein [Anaerotignum sp.]
MQRYGSIYDRWNENFAVYKTYVQEFHNQPKCNTVYHGFRLGQWCSYQRRFQEKLSPDQIGLLEGAGFRF